MILIDRSCYERGCACFDSRIDEDPVEIEVKRTWVGLTEGEVIEIIGAFDYHYNVARAVEDKLKEKNT